MSEETTSTACAVLRFAQDCPSRLLFDQIVDKWSMMVIAALDHGPLRFNVIKRKMEGVTQKALTLCLRRLERNGLIARRVLATSPVAVEYEITALGRSLQPPFKALYDWTMANFEEVERARHDFDRRATLGDVMVWQGASHRDGVRALT